ncbi:MAG: type III-B CRISPR module RAMP protein Cmr1, partial [Candidatus Electrothrix sp. ATG2]|nr:type III-B CRISPR module RAMP protein Cmr1 [Candidatus Electrothrix sp. ATG2]
MPYTLSATYEIVTPMFIGDAQQEAQTVQPASVKGALRFWWRALNWGKYRATAESDEEALKNLHKEEGKLFGRAAEEVNKKQIGGQGGFLLRVINTKSLQKKSEHDLNQDTTYKLGKGSWQSYLLGLGLMKRKDKITGDIYIRDAIISGSFTVELLCRNKEISERIKPALLALGLLGGLGSRSRKGLGSIAIISLALKKGLSANEEPVPLVTIRNREEFIACLKKILPPSNLPESSPPFSAFCQDSKILVSEENPHSSWHALGKIAQVQQMFRGWGFSYNGNPHEIRRGVKTVYDSYSEKEDDHERIYKLAGKNIPEVAATYPRSTVFGLPRSYGLSNFFLRKEITLEPVAMDSKKLPNQENKRSRRASPLLIHIHHFASSGESLIVQTFFPAAFLPPGDQIEVKENITRGDRS